MLKNALASDGFATTYAEDLTEFEALGRQLGALMKTGVGFVQEIRPRAQEQATRPSMSRTFGLGAFPMHTDGAHWVHPPRYVLLRCADSRSDSAPTLVRLTDGLSADLTHRLAACICTVRGRKVFYAPILEFERHQGRFRWDPLVMAPAHPGAASVMREWTDTVQNPDDAMAVTWEPGKVIIADNGRVLHARPPLTNSGRRLLQRLYIA